MLLTIVAGFPVGCVETIEDVLDDGVGTGYVVLVGETAGDPSEAIMLLTTSWRRCDEFGFFCACQSGRY